MIPDNLDDPTAWAMILGALACLLWWALTDRHEPPLTREPDLFEETVYGPRAMYGPLEPIDAGDPFADWTREEFDRLCDDEQAWRTFEAIWDCPERIGEDA